MVRKGAACQCCALRFATFLVKVTPINGRGDEPILLLPDHIERFGSPLNQGIEHIAVAVRAHPKFMNPSGGRDWATSCDFRLFADVLRT